METANSNEKHSNGRKQTERQKGPGTGASTSCSSRSSSWSPRSLYQHLDKRQLQRRSRHHTSELRSLHNYRYWSDSRQQCKRNQWHLPSDSLLLPAYRFVRLRNPDQDSHWRHLDRRDHEQRYGFLRGRPRSRPVHCTDHGIHNRHLETNDSGILHATCVENPLPFFPLTSKFHVHRRIQAVMLLDPTTFATKS